MDMRIRSPLFLAFLVVSACGGANGPSGPSQTAGSTALAPQNTSEARPAPLNGGSSDGVTCEQARDSYHEEVTVGAASSADLAKEDFAAVLNKGTYLEPCALPSSSKVRICAAIQNGHAAGVTVAADPASRDVEVCIAGEIRKLAFPASAKMDFVDVHF